MIFIFLLIWTLIAETTPCIIFVLYILGTTTLLTIALSEIKIINNYLIADRVFYNTASLFHIVKSVWLTLLLSLLVAFSASTILLLQTIYIDQAVILILGMDVIVIWLIHNRIKNKLSLTVKGAFLDAIARRMTVWINTALLIIVFVTYQFYTTPTTEIHTIDCNFLDFLSSTLRYRELVEWKVVSLSMQNMDDNYAFYSWLFYLFMTQGIFAWAYSKLLLSINISKSVLEIGKRGETKNYFLIGFIGAIVLLLISTLFVNHLYEKHHIQKMEKLVKKAYSEIDTRLNQQLKSSEQKILDDIDTIIDKQIEIAFVPVYDAIPGLSNYYYSLKGEYTRIALKGHDLYCEYKNATLLPYYNKFLPTGYKLKKCNEQMLHNEIQSRINSHLFVQNNFSTRIRTTSEIVNSSIISNISNLRGSLKSTMESFESNESISENKQIQLQLHNINAKFNDIFDSSSRDIAKKSLSGVGTIVLSTSISKAIMSKMLLKIGAKSAGKAASFVAGSATGLTVCSPSGPWALLCGVITGTASWIGVDAALTEIDQAFNEDDFQLSVKKMIDSEKHTLKTLMKDSYHQWVLDIFKNLNRNSQSLQSPHKQLQQK
ncbi:hypothetical protein GJV85_10975 [Sulfurimonas aquatica]|uniref:Uncharacterized protein n=1 Tax=Sulfurimonas aquatica TaxID=2672570 RepID=A0A975GDV3_9BACT|nr:hypothetical protein GJV85_10975 [Sulfurimonas aquatica]